MPDTLIAYEVTIHSHEPVYMEYDTFPRSSSKIVAGFIGIDRQKTIDAAVAALPVVQRSHQHAEIARGYLYTGRDLYETELSEPFTARFGDKLRAGAILTIDDMKDWYDKPGAGRCDRCGALESSNALLGPWHPVGKCKQ